MTSNKNENRKQAVTCLIDKPFLFLLCLVVTSPLAKFDRWPKTHENLRYLYLMDHFRDAVQHGVLYPRILPNAFGGYGYPVFIYYQPGYFYWSLPFSLLFDNLVLSAYLTVLVLMWIGAVGAYQVCSQFASRDVCMLCAVIFLFTPYLYVNLYVRGDFSELSAMLLTPWPLYFLLQLLNKTKASLQGVWATVGLVISLVAVIISHPATTLFYFPSLCLMAILISGELGAHRKLFLVRFTTAITLAIALSSPYWLTLFQMKQYVEYHRAIDGFYSAEQHIVYPAQLVSPEWGFGPSLPGIGDQMPFQLGLPHLLLALIGTYASWSNRVIRFASLVYVLLILMMMPISRPLWENISFFSYVQFPWRILSVIAIFQITCIAGLNSIRLLPRTKLIATAILIVSMLLWHSEQFCPSKSPFLDVEKAIKHHRESEWLSRFNSYTGASEFTPRKASTLTDDEPPRGNRPLVEHPGGETEFLPNHSPHYIHCNITSSLPGLATINQIYLPGWHVSLAGRKLTQLELEKHLTSSGLMRVEIPRRDTPVTIIAYYDGPPHWRWRNTCILIFVVLFLVFTFLDRNRIRRVNNTNPRLSAKA